MLQSACTPQSGAVLMTYLHWVQVHPVVSRLCAPIEGTDAAHLADCLGLDPAKFRQQVMAASSDAREEAQLAAASVFDDDDRYKVFPLAVSLDCFQTLAVTIIAIDRERQRPKGKRDRGSPASVVLP